MSIALEYYNTNLKFFPNTREEELNMLFHIEHSAELWIKEKSYFNAGYVYWQGIDVAWGVDDVKLYDCFNKSIKYLSKTIEQLNNSQEIQILSLRLLRDIYSDVLSLGITQKELQNKLSIEFNYVTLKLAAELFKKYNETKCSDFLLKTISIEGDFSTDWCLKLPHEESRIWKEKCSPHKITSAFDLYLSIGDYTNAYEIIKLEQTKFDTNELNGWKQAVIGFMFPDKRIDCFNKVVLEFEKNSKEGWLVSTDIWIKYFKARVFIEVGFGNLETIKDSIISALHVLKGTDKSFLNYQVLRYKYVIEALYGLIELQEPEFIKNVEKQYLKVIDNHVKLNVDYQILTFFKETVDFIKNAHTNYSEAFLKFSDIIKILDTLIFLPITSGKKLKGHISENLKIIVVGGTNWIHRTLESIKDETILHKILLRLFQKLPSQANLIVHGPLEHGRDIYQLEKNTTTLKSYQVKVGNINTNDWRKVKPQMEEMLEVEIPKSLSKYNFDKTIGILIFTGHIKPVVEDKIAGWIQKRLKEMNEKYLFMNIDDIKNFITDNNLIAEFQQALINERIEIIR